MLIFNNINILTNFYNYVCNKVTIKIIDNERIEQEKIAKEEQQQKENAKFEYRQGAVMTNLLLADEINRTSSRTQSALLEVMEEGQVTVDGVTRNIPEPFFVIATQNPLGSAGTQMLPESQMDRFMVLLSMGYPTIKEEMILMSQRKVSDPLDDVNEVISKEELLSMQKEVNEIKVSPLIYQYIAMLSDATRRHDMIQLGVSPRGALALSRMSKARAYLSGRDYVIPEDIQEVWTDVCAHRIVLSPKARISALTAVGVLTQILINIVAPRVELMKRYRISAGILLAVGILVLLYTGS